MKITLFLEDRLVEYILPSQVSGSYSFDLDDDEVDKLINVEARNGKWVLYSTDSVFIGGNNSVIPTVDIMPNAFYMLSRNNINYLIYTSTISNRVVKSFMYDDNSYLKIGNSQDCNILYQNNYLNGLYIELKRENGVVVLKSNLTMYFYVNDNRVNNQEYIINYGDIINFLGLKIMIMPQLLVFNIPSEGVAFRNSSIKEFIYPVEEYANVQIKENELYDKNKYFYKSPRIRRLIEEKEIKLDRPPKLKADDKMPLILTIGPMISMMASSGISIVNTTMKIAEGTTTFKNSWPTFAMCGVMMMTSFVWPSISRRYNKKLDKKNNKDIVTKYTAYLNKKRNEFEEEAILQKSILEENLINYQECLNIINTRKNNFWSKRKEHNDFLEVRVGIGRIPLKVKVSFPEDEFTMEEDNLKKMADDMLDKSKELSNVPLGYSLYENYLTGVMGEVDKGYNFINNIILQLMTFYCYDELKFIIFTGDKSKKRFDYLKYSNYNFSNNKSVRYFAENDEEYKNLSEYLMQELMYRIELVKGNKAKGKDFKQYYVIICDNYSEAKKLDFFKELMEVSNNVGYSTIILENMFSNLPSKCVNFINLNNGISTILKNSFESAAVTEFHDEVNGNVNMMEVVKILSNVPVEIDDEEAQLPNSIGFLEMEKVGKVEQLNIMNRWNTNDSTKSLKTEIGVDPTKDLMYLDLHEKAHGPHGLIAGMTGSGKSEFIITYILSLAMNYSPDDVSFVLIDYKGGGLAGAFENEKTGVRLPHLAGTITNLDKAELNRTLVSIDSEVKRRQEMFNNARDSLGESTIDIYKYQGYYHRKKLKEPIPHLFIICDEFAELKSQQPEFMDNLISVARIGRSLGVHLILATQKPSGVVNDQIWSNSKFRVCLKVQDTSDSNEMLKKPDAANIKQTGRFYLQVGYDEYFALGQSAWCGAKYFPSEKVVKSVDKSVDIINNVGQIIKKGEDDSVKNKVDQGEQIAAVMSEIINVSNQANKYARRLWLDNIPTMILSDNIEKKYNIQYSPFNVKAVIGEYDAPELQQQGIVLYDLLRDGNTLIYGTDGTDKELLLNSMIYSITKNYPSNEVNIYVIDYGSESTRVFAGLPHFGGIVTAGDEEKYNNLLKMIREEIKVRKELFVNYGGEYKNYINNSGEKLPLKLIIINNYDALKGSISNLYEEMPELVRDSDRYGIIFVITANGSNSVGQKVLQNCNNAYCLRLKDVYEYSSLLGAKVKNEPRETLGRGMCNINGVHEFQTVNIVEDETKFSDYMMNFVNEMKNKNMPKAKKIPSLPINVMIDDVEEIIKDQTNVPIGIAKNTLEVVGINLLENVGNLVLSNKLDNTKGFVKSLMDVLKKFNDNIIFLDMNKTFTVLKDKVNNYYDDKYDLVVDNLTTYVNECMNSASNVNTTIIISSLSRLASKISDQKKLENLFNLIKKYEKIGVIAIDEPTKLKQYTFETWYRSIFTGQEGVWIGSGVSEQQLLKISSYNKEFRGTYKNDMGFFVSSGDAVLVKLLDFYKEGAGK